MDLEVNQIMVTLVFSPRGWQAWRFLNFPCSKCFLMCNQGSCDVPWTTFLPSCISAPSNDPSTLIPVIFKISKRSHVVISECYSKFNHISKIHLQEKLLIWVRPTRIIPYPLLELLYTSTERHNRNGPKTPSEMEKGSVSPPTWLMWRPSSATESKNHHRWGQFLATVGSDPCFHSSIWSVTNILVQPFALRFFRKCSIYIYIFHAAFDLISHLHLHTQDVTNIRGKTITDFIYTN